MHLVEILDLKKIKVNIKMKQMILIHFLGLVTKKQIIKKEGILMNFLQHHKWEVLDLILILNKYR